MGYKTLVSMNIAIAGNGKYSVALAKGLANAGHNIFLVTMDDEDVVGDELLWQYDNICPASPEYAGAVADLVVMACHPRDVRAMAYFLDDVRQKVIVDLSSLSITPFDEYINTAAAIKAITGSAHVIKCYNRTGNENLIDPHADSTADMIIAGSSKKGKAVVKLLAKDLQFDRCLDFGDDQMIPMLDSMSIDWQQTSLSKRLNNSIAYKLISR